MEKNKKGKGFWNKLKVDWYKKGVKFSGMDKAILRVIRPLVKDTQTILDVGAGTGMLSIPLAKSGKIVTALDSSANMLAVLKEEAKKKKLSSKIRTINAPWGERKIKAHDTIICANVPELLKPNDKEDKNNFLSEVNNLAKKSVFLILGADPLADKFYYKELMPLIFSKEFRAKSDYLLTYTRLHEQGIFANVNIIEYDFDQPFKDLEEAILFWKEYMGIVTEEHDETLRKFLEKKLVKSKNGLLAKFHKKSAVIWWKKNN